jgi:hypothetical protein
MLVQCDKATYLGWMNPEITRMRHLTLAAIFAAGLLPGAPAQAAELAEHRAMYGLSLESARGDVIAASGSMVYEVTDACDAWAVRQRLKMTLTNRDGQDIDMVSDYTTWESKDGLKLRFRLRQMTEDAVTSEVTGDASLERRGGPGEVHYVLPEEVTKKLPAGTLFPMAHTEVLLDAAKAGQKFLTLPLFDGTGAEGAQDSTVAIVGWAAPQDSKWPTLSALPSSRVRVAFFGREAAAQQPDYEVGMKYWANGIADNLQMDFGDFVMTGKITDLKIPKHAC